MMTVSQNKDPNPSRLKIKKAIALALGLMLSVLICERRSFGINRNANNFLNRYSKFYIWQKETVDRLVVGRLQPVLIRLGIIQLDYTTKLAQYSAEYPEELEKSWKLTEKLILEIRTNCASHGSQFLLVSIPEARQVYDNYWLPAEEEYKKYVGGKLDRTRPQKILRNFTRKADIDYVSLLTSFQIEKNENNDKYFFGEGHFNEYGHRVVAETILSEVNRYLPKVASTLPASTLDQGI